MPISQYNTLAGRINRLKGEIIAHAIPVECLGITGNNKKMPRDGGDTLIFRRYLPFSSTTANQNTQNRMTVSPLTHLTSEGVTPAADTLVAFDVSVTIQQYACLYSVTDKMVDLYEDDIPKEMKTQTGERVGLLREMIRYGALRAGTNYYPAGGTSRATVSQVISYNLLQRIARNLMANHAKPVTEILEAGPKFNTAPVEAAFLVFCHTDIEHDIRNLPNFKHVSEYGNRKPVHDMEIGSMNRFRFIVSPELAPYPDAGATVVATGLVSTTGTNIDVYPLIVVAQDAWGEVALRGKEALDVTWIPPGQKDTADPLGQRGYIGAKFYSAAVVLNNGWLAVAEVGASVI